MRVAAKIACSETCDANPGMRPYAMDVTDPVSVRQVTAQVIADFPALNCVFNNAGVQRRHDFRSGSALDETAMLSEIDTNLLGVIRIAAAFLPKLLTQRNATLVNVSSGLAFVPMARFPVYCATKAAVHSFTLSLRHQMKDSGRQDPRTDSAVGGNGAAGGSAPTPPR